MPSDFAPVLLLITGLALAIYLVNKLAKNGAASPTTPPPGAPPGTLRLGQYAVQPGAQWLVLTPGVQ